MTAEQNNKMVALAAAFVPYLRDITTLASYAEVIVGLKPSYGPFIAETKLLNAQFADLCRAGDTEKMIERFRQTLFLCMAAQQPESKAVN